MSKCDLKLELEAAQKDAMRAKDKPRLGTIRMILSEIKRIEVDGRIDIDDQRIIATLDKMLKQRRDSISQFRDAGRDELAEQEELEITVIQSFLPVQLTADEINAIVKQALASADAKGMQHMGKVMALVKPQIQGKADVGAVSGIVKKMLSDLS